jgi:uncharacterized protein (TIGR02246 family)
MTETSPTSADAYTHSAIDAVERGWTSAIVANDADRIAEFMTDDWVIVSASGVMTAAVFLSLIRSGELIHTAMDPVGGSRVRFHGDAALLTVRVTSIAEYGGRQIPADEWTTSVFVRRDGRWLCDLTQITAVTDAGDVETAGTAPTAS